MDNIKSPKSLSCVNGWCKYKDGFYCNENCGSYMPEGIRFRDIKIEKIRSIYLLVFDFNTGENIRLGLKEEIFTNCSEFQNCEVLEAHYGISESSFIVGLGKEI